MIVEGVLGFGDREHRPLQWPCVSLGTIQVLRKPIFGLFSPHPPTLSANIIKYHDPLRKLRKIFENPPTPDFFSIMAMLSTQ